MTNNYDFVAIGDTGTDAFIRLETPSVHIDIDKGKREIAMSFADKVPYKEVYIVPGIGNSANAAVAASRLGLKSALVSNIGDDYFGEECLGVFKKEKVETKFIKRHKNAKTNYHYVLWFDDDRTILVKHEEYPYELPEIGEPGWIYLSSAAKNSLPWHKSVEDYLNKHPNIKLAFQPGGFQIGFGKDSLSGIYKRSKVVIVNKEESQTILETGEGDIKKLLGGMRKLGPEIAVITDGVKGAYVSYDGEDWYMPLYPDPKPPLERTGAGDAFSSTFVAALCLGMSVSEALRWAPINSMSVVQYVGAREGLLKKSQIEEYLAKAPADYEPKR
ncbi:MAG: carbohydrate kinase family protein, partial [Candidatus Colwellbacteria bacterium]